MIPCHQCVVLAVDTAANSGWAIFSCGVKLNSGQVSIYEPEKLLGICQAALKWRGELPACMVLERAYGAQRNRTQTLLGLGAARHAWRQAWRQASNTKTPRRVVSVLPQVWRAQLGLPQHKLPRQMQVATLKAHELDYPHREVGPDEFEALMIGLWATRCAEVRTLLFETRRAANDNAPRRPTSSVRTSAGGKRRVERDAGSG